MGGLSHFSPCRPHCELPNTSRTRNPPIPKASDYWDPRQTQSPPCQPGGYQARIDWKTAFVQVVLLCCRLPMYDFILPGTSFSFLDLSLQLQITFLHSSQCTAHSTCGETTAWLFCHESCLQKRHLQSPAGTPVLTRRGQELY